MSFASQHAPFDAVAFLSSRGFDRRTIELEPEEPIFTQGNLADTIFCLKSGRAKLVVLSEKGKQATITILSRGDFFGEESLRITDGLRTATATAVNKCTAYKIKRDEMLALMHQEQGFSDQFLSYLLTRSVRTQADLVDQIFNSSERRLARALLLMAESSRQDEAQILLPPITQETLAEMIGTTRSRVSFFMNRFRSLGFITYKDRIHVDKPRLRAALMDQCA